MRSFRIGLLLAVRQVQRSSIWTTVLIISVMTLTFLNLIAVSGILVGLIEGAERAVKENSLGDIIIKNKDGEDRILKTETFIKNISTYPEVDTFSVRFQGNATIEANYQERRDLSGERDTAAVTVNGIDPEAEKAMSKLDTLVVDGEYLDPNEEGQILIGVYYLKRYAENFGDIFDTIENVYSGDKVRMTVGDVSKEFTVKGIIESKVDEVNFAVYIPEREFRRLFGRLERNADSIVVRLKDTNESQAVVDSMRDSHLDNYAKIQTYEESKPKFITDIKDTMNLLGTVIGSIGLVVASITIFIIIFINALSRRRHIGILKGIGIERKAIEIAYVLQAGFYALSGSLLGAIITYVYLVPHFEKYPIQFPFSDGILTADPEETFWRFITLFVVTLIAGFIPAWMIVRQNTLNSILGRK